MSKPPTPEAIDRLLRKAGHQRHDKRTGMTRYSIGYTIGDAMTGPVTVSWNNGPDDDPAHVWAALHPIAATLTEAGYTGERSEYVTVIDGETYCWPCLVISVRKDPK